MNMEKLLKEYNLGYAHEYFNMVVESVGNGQFKQAQEQFNNMPPTERADLLGKLADASYMDTGDWPRNLAYSTLKKLLTVIY